MKKKYTTISEKKIKEIRGAKGRHKTGEIYALVAFLTIPSTARSNYSTIDFNLVNT